MGFRVARVLLVLAVVAALTALGPSTSNAGTDIGQFCWTMSPFIDTLRISVNQAGGSAADVFEMHVRWRAAGFYQLLGAGLATGSFPTTGSFDVGIVAAHNTTSFGANQICNLYARISPSTLGGPWTLKCPGAAADFTNSGTLVATTCSSVMEEATGPAAGQ